MAKTGYLPDIAQSFFFWQKEALSKLNKEKYNEATGSLFNLNECLSEDYMVKVSTQKYRSLTKLESYYVCGNCTMDKKVLIPKEEDIDDEMQRIIQVPSQILLEQVKIEKRLLPIIRQVTRNIEYAVGWVCPKCNFFNEKSPDGWTVYQEKRMQPYTLGVVQEPPKQLDGISNRLSFQHEYANWFYNFFKEIQAKMVIYRKDYVAQTGQEMNEENGYIDLGDDDK